MEISKHYRCHSIILLAALLASGCSGSGSSDIGTQSQSYSYATTSSKGDYSEWTISGNHLDATWNIVSSSGSIDYTFQIAATCGTADSFGVRSCVIDTSSCSDGVSSCPASPSGSFDMMDVPGVALFAHTGSGGGAQLHIGFARDTGACLDDVSGDYTMIRTGLGLNENFGLYRSDANFINILHTDFGFDTPDMNTTTQTVAYRTGSEAEALINDGCVDGVRTRGLGGGVSIRSMMTASGLFVLDLPAGQGGMISFKTANAASLADFANKSFGGISFPDNSGPEAVSAEFGPLTGDQVDFSVAFSGGSSGSESLKALATTASATAPAYPDFNTSPTGYNASVLSMDYTSPASIPGLFKIDNPADSGRVILAAMKFSGKVIGVGMVYNYRTTSDINPNTGASFPSDGLYNTGNFLLFEK